MCCSNYNLFISTSVKSSLGHSQLSSLKVPQFAQDKHCIKKAQCPIRQRYISSKSQKGLLVQCHQKVHSCHCFMSSPFVRMSRLGCLSLSVIFCFLILLLIRGTASDVAGMDSDTVFRNTVNERRIVTSEKYFSCFRIDQVYGGAKRH